MNAKQWMTAGIVALLIGSWSFPSLATASVVKSEDLAKSCSGGCVDIWQVNCTDTKTTFVAAKVKDPSIGDDVFAVTTIGYKSPAELIGQADLQMSPAGSTQYSLSAWIKRAGLTHGASSAFVKINLESSSSGAANPAYSVEFSCKDYSFSEIGTPAVKLLQDQ